MEKPDLTYIVYGIDVQISPDGTEIAFCYKGDIYKVPSNGGTATQLTTQASYESVYIGHIQVCQQQAVFFLAYHFHQCRSIGASVA